MRTIDSCLREQGVNATPEQLLGAASAHGLVVRGVSVEGAGARRHAVVHDADAFASWLAVHRHRLGLPTATVRAGAA